MFCDVKFGEYNLQDVGVTQSMIKTFLTCPIKFLYSVNRYYNPSWNSRSTGFGSMFHHVLEKVYGRVHKGKPLPRVEMITEWIDEFIQEHPGDISGKDDTEVQLDALMIEVLSMEYIDNYKNDFTKAKVVFEEKPIVVKWNNYLLRCKIDLCLNFGGVNYTLDHKTMSRINESAMGQMLAFDLQHQFYTLCTELSEKIKIGGSYHNIIRRPEDKFDGDFVRFRKTLTDKVRRDPKHYFKRYIITYTQRDKEEFKREIGNILESMDALISSGTGMYRNPTRCLDFSACGFLGPCSSNSMAGFEQGDSLFNELGEEYAYRFKNQKRKPRK